MKRLLLISLLLFVLSGWGGAQDGQAAFSLERLVDKVLSRNAGLRTSQARVDEAEEGWRETRWRRFPILSARSTFTRGDQPVYVFGSLMEQGRFGPNDFAINSLNHPNDLTNIQSSLDLGVPLFTGFDLTSAARQNELAARQAQRGQEGAAQRLRLETATAYLQLLQARAQSKELDERLAASEEEIDNAQKLKDRGVVLGSDFFAARSIYGGLQAWKVQVHGEEQTAQTRLEILSGQSDVIAAGQLTESTYTIPSAKEAEGQAITRRPDLAAAATAVEQAEESSKQSGHSLLPRVDAFASLQTNTNDFGSNPSNHLYGVAASLPFGDPGYMARRSRAASGAAAAKSAKEAAEESTRIDVDQAYQAYQSTLESLNLVKETADSAAKSLQLFRPLYRSGRQSIIEVLRAEEGLAKARAAYWQTLYQLHAGYLRLMAATGGLDDKAIRETAQRLEVKP